MPILIAPTVAAAVSAPFTLADGDIRTLNMNVKAGHKIRNDALVRVEIQDTAGNWLVLGTLGLNEGMAKNLYGVGTFRIAKDATDCAVGCDGS